MVALLDRGDAGTDVDHDAGALVAEDRGKQPFRIGARQREFVGVTDAGRLDLDQHFALARAFEVDGCDFERFTGGKGDSGTGFHEEDSAENFAADL